MYEKDWEYSKFRAQVLWRENGEERQNDTSCRNSLYSSANLQELDVG